MTAANSLFLVGLASLFLARPGAAQPATRQRLTPLTFQTVSAFVSHTLHIRATEVHPRCTVFYEGEWRNDQDYSYCVIIVENSDADLQITFYFTDDREMNWVNEFLDGPFFTKDETERLFDLLYRRRPARSEKVGRFRVDVSQWQPRHAEILVFSFTPAR